MRSRAPWTIALIIAGLVSSAAAWLSASLPSGSAAVKVFDGTLSEGDRRTEVLRHLTETYVARGQGVSLGMRKGLELAPAAFLNMELERQDSKWRVASVRGSDATFFDIS